MKKPLGFALFIIACAIGLLSESKVPKLTDAQKLEIRTEQVAFLQAKDAMESTPQFKQFQDAQSKLNQSVQRIMAEAKVNQSEYTLGPDLEFTAVPKPPAPPEKK